MSNYFIPIAAPQAPPALDFNPLNQALTQTAKTNVANRGLDLQQQELALRAPLIRAQIANAGIENQLHTAQLYGGVAQAGINETDPGKRQAIWDGIRASHPQFDATLKAHGIDPSNADVGLGFVANEARGYQLPEELALKRAQATDVLSQAGLRGQQLDLARRQMDMQQRYFDSLPALSGSNGQSAPQTFKTPDGKSWGLDSDGNYREIGGQ
jgi:hypothetical protein